MFSGKKIRPKHFHRPLQDASTSSNGYIPVGFTEIYHKSISPHINFYYENIENLIFLISICGDRISVKMRGVLAFTTKNKFPNFC